MAIEVLTTTIIMTMAVSLWGSILSILVNPIPEEPTKSGDGGGGNLPVKKRLPVHGLYDSVE